MTKGPKVPIMVRVSPDVANRFEVVQKKRRRSKSDQVAAWVDAEFQAILLEVSALDQTKAAEAERLLMEE